MADLSVIIPTYNECDNVHAITEAFNHFVKNIDFSIELVFVDDGSSDETLSMLKEENFECNVSIVKLSKNYGSHAAIRAGVLSAEADCCMFYYMDMSEPITCIEAFYHKLKEGYSIVYSERVGYKAGLGSRIFAKLVIQYIEKSYPKNGVSSIAFNGKVKKELNRNIENNSSVFFQIFQMGFNKIGIPIEIQERTKGKSKWTFSKKIKLFIDSFVMFSYMPIRAISVLGVVLSILGILWAGIIVICKLTGMLNVSIGWPTISCILLIGFGVTNISLGILSEYLVRTLDASRNRSVFIIEDIYKYKAK